MVSGHFSAFPEFSGLLGEAGDGFAHLCSFLVAGLALERYTHFTSPIRRYADIVVHRLLMAATLRGTTGDVKDNIISNKDLEELCRHINNRNRVWGFCENLHGALGNGIPVLTVAFGN